MIRPALFSFLDKKQRILYFRYAVYRYFSGTRRHLFLLLALLSMGVALVTGVALGLVLAKSRNVTFDEGFGVDRPSLPTRVLDRHGQLITQLFSHEKREIISVREVPDNLIAMLITREDKDFFHHNGFSLKGTLRALAKIVTRSYFSGGSTMTQQLAGNLYADRTEITIGRKLRELWWAWQLEKRLSKYEILELYINKMAFGHSTYGVEAASRFYFGHSVRENNAAESAILAIQLANPSGRYSPIRNPERARRVQKLILDQATAKGFLTQEQADEAFLAYWEEYDWSRAVGTTAFFERDDKVPFFSEYVREKFEGMLQGRPNMYEGGYTVHTTLDLAIQERARSNVDEGLALWNQRHRESFQTRMGLVDTEILPILDLLSLSFNLPSLYVRRTRNAKQASHAFDKEIAPILEISSLLFEMKGLNHVANVAHKRRKSRRDKENAVESALITLDNETGYILAMIGGSQFSRTNQFNRAMHGSMMPGSAFKPLFYYRAIASGKLTAASRLYDGPSVFWNPDGVSYTPSNYGGHWYGYVLVRDALAESLNIPAIQVLDIIGFDEAIKGASRILGFTDPQRVTRLFPRRYPLALGIVSVAPIDMARAFATFANQGSSVEPLAIRYVEDRDGNVILNLERDLRYRQQSEDRRIMSPQVAAIMTSMLVSSVEYGTLSLGRKRVGGFGGMPMAGKTGTTQNAEDAWAVGFSPYYTTILWVGFDQRNNTLGSHQSGAITAGPVWARYMKMIHENLSIKPFRFPQSGLVSVPICKETGLLATDSCSEGTRNEIFLAGTQPVTRSPDRTASRQTNALRNKLLGGVSESEEGFLSEEDEEELLLDGLNPEILQENEYSTDEDEYDPSLLD